MSKPITNAGHRRIRYAVVGLGNLAQTAVLPAFAHADENSEVVALVSSSEEKLRVLGERYAVAVRGGYADLERVLAEANADAIYLATPNALHRAFTERAARVGVHVLCEKPMATSEADCRAMIDVTRVNDVKLMIAYRLHFEETNVRAIERIRRGEIGEPRVFSSLFCQQVREGDVRTKAEQGGGALFDMGVYCINAARYLFQEEPYEVYAEQSFGEDSRFREVDEMTAAILRFPHGRLAQFTVSQGAVSTSELQVTGTRGALRLAPAYGYRNELREQLMVAGHEDTHTTPPHDQFAPELLHFSACILEGREPVPSGLQGLADVRIIEALIRSARTGGRVPVAPVDLLSRPNGSLVMTKPPVKEVRPVNAPPPTT